MATKKRTSTPHPRKHISHSETHIYLRKSVFVYAVLVFMTFFMIALTAISVQNYATAEINDTRYSRILGIYDDIALDDTYRSDRVNVFGDKRPYSWDTSRTEASSVTYGRNAGREATFADLKQRITTAGFTQIDGPNYGDPARQDHYKSADGEYIRVSITGKAAHDSMLYGTPMPEMTPETIEAGPVYVTIKVNLDDNNE